MKIGSVKEIKTHEYRVGLTPVHVASYVEHKHQVYIEKGAGLGSGFEDKEYVDAGAIMCDNAQLVWDQVDMIVKVKEPLESEYQYFREGLIIYTYLHLAADKALTDAMLAAKVSGVAYETITDDDNQLPLLKPMSEVAGRLSIQEGAKYLEKPYGGRGVLLPGVPGVSRGNVVIIGGGVVGTNAAKIAVGIGANVTIMDRSLKRLEELDHLFGSSIQTLYSTELAIAEQVAQADLVVGAVLIPGASAPKVVKRYMLKNMKAGSVIVDVAVDQGGCTETTKRTYHDDPVYVVDDVVHYCVANMPGATPRSSTQALTNATLAIGLEIANHGLEVACVTNSHIANGVNTYKGKITYASVAEAFDQQHVPLSDLL